VLLGPTYVEDAYELYWNGTRIGGCGDFGERPPKAYATRPTLMRLPLRSTSGESVIAIRVYLSPAMRRNGDAGGVHIAPILAKQHAGESRYAAQWAQTLRGYAVDAVEPALLILLIAALALFAARVASPGQFGLALGAALALTAALRANQAVYFWAEVEGLRAFLIVKGFILEPLGLLAWTVAWNRWSRPSRASIDIAAVALTVVTAGAALAGDSFALARGTARVGFVVLFLVIAVRIARRGSDRPLALSAMALVATGQFAEELWMLKVPGIWFPFGVGVSRTQYAYALLIPLLAALLARRALQAAARAPPSRARLSSSLAEAGE